MPDAYAHHVCDLPPDHLAKIKEVFPPQMLAELPLDHHCVCGARGG